MLKRRILWAAAGVALLLTGYVVSKAQSPVPNPVDDAQLPVSDPICTFFGSDHAKIVGGPDTSAATVTTQVAALIPNETIPHETIPHETGAALTLPSAPGGSRTGNLQRATE